MVRKKKTKSVVKYDLSNLKYALKRALDLVEGGHSVDYIVETLKKEGIISSHNGNCVSHMKVLQWLTTADSTGKTLMEVFAEQDDIKNPNPTYQFDTKVQCIDNTNYQEHLDLFTIYDADVRNADPEMLWVKGKDGKVQECFKRRFKVVL